MNVTQRFVGARYFGMMQTVDGTFDSQDISENTLRLLGMIGATSGKFEIGFFQMNAGNACRSLSSSLLNFSGVRSSFIAS
jgi:hypothetical protein